MAGAQSRRQDDADVLDAWRRSQEAVRSVWAAARRDPVLFNAAVLRDERTGAPIRIAPLHEEWHDLVDRHDRVVVWSAPDSGKTNQLSVGRVLYELGRNHNLRVAVVSRTFRQAEKVVGAISKYIRTSKACKAITGLRPGSQWSNTAITVERDQIAKDPSVQATGIDSGGILGSRVDLLVIDDILDYENTRTPDARQKLIEWFQATLTGRLTQGARVVVVGTAFHPGDLLHALARTPGWTATRFPVVDEATGQSRWPEHWPAERIERARQEMTPLEFARQLLCRARSDEGARFQWAWIERCLKLGEGRQLAYGLQSVPPGCRVVTGVDLAVQQHSSADLTVLFTIVVHPPDRGELREVLSIESGRWAGPEIVARIVDAHRRYQSLVVVENNGAQDFIVQFARARSAVPIRAYMTGRAKAHPEFGVESLAAEMAAGKWLIPNEGGKLHPEVDAWVNEMLYYDPRSHTGDRLMASFFCREGIRLSGIKAEVGRLDTLARM